MKYEKVAHLRNAHQCDEEGNVHSIEIVHPDEVEMMTDCDALRRRNDL